LLGSGRSVQVLGTGCSGARNGCKGSVLGTGARIGCSEVLLGTGCSVRCSASVLKPYHYLPLSELGIHLSVELNGITISPSSDLLPYTNFVKFICDSSIEEHRTIGMRLPRCVTFMSAIQNILESSQDPLSLL
jgi:hypothetical protein